MTSTSRKYDLVVFDWDGTVMDTTGLIAEGKGDVMITETMEAKLPRARPKDGVVRHRTRLA